MTSPVLAVATGAIALLGRRTPPIPSRDHGSRGVNAPIGLRFEGAYNGLQIKDSGGDVRIISGTANAIFNIGHSGDAPYLIAGHGGYNRRLTVNPFGSTRDKTD